MLNPSEVMPLSTASLFGALYAEPEISDFYLIGGTALALHIGHRLSEDLDFIIKTPTLPRERIDRVIARLRNNNLSVQRNDSDAAYDEFEYAGMTLHDYSQNFIVAGTCKLTFFPRMNTTASSSPRVCGKRARPSHLCPNCAT